MLALSWLHRREKPLILDIRRTCEVSPTSLAWVALNSELRYAGGALRTR